MERPLSTPIPIKKKVAILLNTKSYFEKKTGMYTKNDLPTLAEELKTFLASIEQPIETAPEIVPIKPVNKPVPQV
jgi:hypothetical protein